MLPQNDNEYLTTRFGEGNYSIAADANMTCVVVKELQLPTGFSCEKTDLLIRLKPGYPDIAPDMWWFDPPVRRADTKPIPATDVIENHLGRSWQRWSRHFTNGQWKSGIDSLESYFALINRELIKSAS